MIRRIAAMIPVILLLAGVCAPAAAGFETEGHQMVLYENFAVYTGPGTNYYRVNGNAAYGAGNPGMYFGTERNSGWMLIGYETSKGLWRTGYVEPGAEDVFWSTTAGHTYKTWWIPRP